jgi:hypothetical protein
MGGDGSNGELNLSDEHLTPARLGPAMFRAAERALGAPPEDTLRLLEPEVEKLAGILRDIIEDRTTGEMREEEARLLLLMERLSIQSALTAAEAMDERAAESTIDAALHVAADLVNEQVGFLLL